MGGDPEEVAGAVEFGDGVREEAKEFGAKGLPCARTEGGCSKDG